MKEKLIFLQTQFAITCNESSFIQKLGDKIPILNYIITYVFPVEFVVLNNKKKIYLQPQLKYFSYT